jgi:HK97 family phage major capsid protein
MSKDEQTIEIDQEVTSAVAKEAAEQVTAGLEIPSADAIAEKVLASIEATKKEAVEEAPTQTKTLKKGISGMDSRSAFRKAMEALHTGDRSVIREYNQNSQKQWSEKANYQNVGTAADGGAIVPDPEFVAEVDRNTDEYGAAARETVIRTTDRDSVTLLGGTNEVSFTKVGEATATNASKLTYEATTRTLDKYVLKLIMTNEWIEDAAVDVFADAASEVGRARAKLIDQLTFTDSTYGLLSLSTSIKTQTVGANLAAFDFDDAMDAALKVKSPARRNGKFYMHPSVWNELRQTKTGDASNSAAMYYAGPPGQAPAPMIDGYEVVFVDVMPDAGDITANEAFAVFGDLSKITHYFNRTLKLDVFDAGVVTDAGGSDFNLIDQDAQALRASLRAVPHLRFEDYFCLIGTGTVS